MKYIMASIQEFLEARGLSIDSIQLKLSENGKLEYCTGTFKRAISKVSRESIVQDFKKELSSVDIRFSDTELELTSSNKFIIL
jgi:hypothetical protein